MKTEFVEGDVLIYFNSDVAFVVLLDQVDEVYFTIVTSQNSHYEYGFKIKIRNLTSKHFLKVDKKFLRISGDWERFELDHNLLTIAQVLNFN